MEKITVKWQRLVKDKETCPRCEQTGEEVEKAVSKLKKSLKPMNIDVELEKNELSLKEFKKSPLESNLIEINGKPLEEWLNAKTGKSECCDICGPNDCRTVEVNGKTYEKIPADLIIKAGLAAASNLSIEKENESCCDDNEGDSNTGCCC
jgi:hypothetical protein